MQQDYRATNRITVTGTVEGDYTFSHRVYGEGFYSFIIRVPRLSDTDDLLPVTISERLMEGNPLYPNTLLTIRGQLRSYNTYSENRNHLILSIFTKEIIFPAAEEPLKEPPNTVCLNGFICKPPLYRTTPLGREISDILLAVNRAYGKSDYIPLIAWGRNAVFSKNLTVGANLNIEGRMQSRAYQKKFDNGEAITKTAYEVSVSKMELISGEF